MKRLLDTLDRWGRKKPAWWAWPLILLLMAVFSDAAAITLQPLGAEWVALPSGERFGDTCAMITQAGIPCPQCGMTRSWVHGIRLNLIEAFWYNPAGLALFAWVNVGGVFGAIRLVRRDPRAARVHELVFFAWLMIWLIGLYLGGYLIRLAGWMPLP